MRKTSNPLFRHAGPSVAPSPRRVLAGVLAASVVAAVAVVGPLGSTPAAAAPGSFLVDDPIDAVDAAPDGTCATSSGTCTLRAAIQEANAALGTTEIRFAPSADTSSLTLSGLGGAEVGDLDIAPGATVRLIGNQISETDTTVVKADALGDRHVEVGAGARLELEMVHLAGGSTDGDGGAIRNEGAVLVTNRVDSTGTYIALSGNSAAGSGGAIANVDGATLEVQDISLAPTATRVDIDGNVAGADGGGISNGSGTVVLSGREDGASHDVYLDSNSAVGDGGAVHNTSGSVTLGCRAFTRYGSATRGGDVFNGSGSLTFAGGGIEGGSATGDGGGLHNDKSGKVTVEAGACGTRGSIAGATAGGRGGGMYNLGTVSVPVDATLSIDGADKGRDASSGGGIAQAGGSFDVAGTLTLGSLVAEKDGGGIEITGGTFTTSDAGAVGITKTTSGSSGGGIAVTGGSLDATVRIDSSSSSRGGGLAVAGSGTASLRQSSVMNNSASSGAGADVQLGGSLTALNTTFGRNTAMKGGGGAVNVMGGSLSLRFVTVADNSPDGVRSDTGVGFSAVLMARNSGVNCGNAAASSGDRNVFDDATCAPTGEDLDDSDRFDDVADLLEADPTTGDPDSYDLSAGHPAIDRVSGKGCGDPAVDQNGSSRPLDGDGDGAEDCDAGAVEAPSGKATSLHTIRGTVYDETTRRPLPGACVFMTRIGDDGDGDDGNLVQTDAQGRYVGDAPDGTYLMAFFVPLADADADSDRKCGESGFDRSYQPEWHRNVPIEFEAEAAAEDDGDDDKVIMPDLAEVTLVTVAGADVTLIDACLGKGPGAGLDVPCSDAAEGFGTPAPPSEPAGATEGAGTESLSTTPPRSLAFTGLSGVLVLLSVGLTMAGTAFLLAGRRRDAVFPGTPGRG